MMFELFWSEYLWLKPGTTWSDLEPKDGRTDLVHHSDLYYMPLLAAAFIYVIRNYFLLPYIFIPIGKHYGIRSKPYNAPEDNSILLKLFKVNRARPPHHLLENCAKEIGWDERKIERWLRQKTLSQQMTTLEKFCDFGFQFVYHTFAVSFGFLVLTSEDFFWDIEKCFTDYPHIPTSTGLKIYIHMIIGFYIVQTVLLFTLTRRHDFYVMLTHHFCTFFIAISCYIAKTHKIIALTALLHDMVDIFMGLGKLFYYCGRTDISNVMSALFCIVWFPTRLVIYPLVILRGTMFVAPAVFGVTWPAYYVINVIAVLLLILHIIWTTELIPAMLIKMRGNETFKDSRSSPDEMSEEDQPNVAKKKK